MTFRLIPLAPRLAAAPGDVVIGRVEIHNDGPSATTFTVSVVGLDSGRRVDPVIHPPTRVSIDPGQSAIVDVPVAVPPTLGIGEHAAAFEATSSSPNDRAVLTPFTLSIASVDRVELVAVPSTIRAHRRASFHLDVTNNEPQAVEFALTGEAPDVDVEFTPRAAMLLPGQRLIATGKVKGPRHWSGEPTQHNLLIAARGRAATTTITTPYVQRPVFAHRFRMVLAGFMVVALWLAAIGGVAFWLATRDDPQDAAAGDITAVDTDGDGVPDAFYDADGEPLTAVDTDGDGIPDAFYDADGNLVPTTDADGDGVPDNLVGSDGQPIEAIDTDGDGVPDTLSDGSVDPGDEVAGPAEPQATILRGTVSADGDTTAVAITLSPIALGDTPSEESTPIGFRGTEPRQPEGKIWSARYGVVEGISSTVRRTVSIAPQNVINPGADGVFLFTDVLQGQSYEISFALAGYDTQSFVVTPAADGKPIDLDVNMKPSTGSLAGTVVGPSGSKNAAISISDGTIAFQTTADSTTGAWSIDGVSTPGVYTMTAELRGYATAVRQVELRPGQDVSDITLQMVPGLGTITGRVVDTAGNPLGGVTVSATNGETVLNSTTLTQGDVGFFSLPQIAVPATYTVSATLDGYITETRRVPLNGSIGGIDFVMVSETINLGGRVTDEKGAGITNAGLVVSTGDLTFRASTSAAPNAGVFSIDRLPPGTYTITIEHYEYESATEVVTLVAGVDPPPLDVTLVASSGPPDIGRGSLVVDVINSDPTIAPAGIDGATVTISRNRSGEPPKVLTDPDASTVRFEDLVVGTYTVRVSAPGYNTSQPITRSVGLQEQQVQVALQKLGSASGKVVDAVSGAPILAAYQVRIFRQTSTGEVELPPAIGEQTTGDWQTTSVNQLPTGVYRVEIDQASLPHGYIARNEQILDASPSLGGATMRFIVPEVTNAKVEPVVLPTIKVDRLPTIVGQIRRPTYDGTATPKFDWYGDGGGEPAFTVTATCNGKTIPTTKSSTGGDADLDTFTLSRESLATAFPNVSSLPGTCTLGVAATGHVSPAITLLDVDASRGATSTTPSATSDRVVATTLVPQAVTFDGEMFWIEPTTPTQRRPLSGTVSTGSVITAFTSTEGLPGSTPSPGFTRSVLTDTVGTDGLWQIAGHLFGPTNYSFSAANFGVGVVPVNVTQSGASFPSSAPTAATVTGTHDIELRPPAPGTLEATVTINSNTPDPYPAASITATAPNATTPAMIAAGNNVFRIDDAQPGNWSLAFGTPINHRRVLPGATATVETFIAPGGVADPPVAAEFTELGSIDISLTTKGASPTAITDALDVEVRDVNGVEVTTVDVASLGDGDYRISQIPVDDDPDVTTTYTVALALDDYDLARAFVNGGGTPTDVRTLSVPIAAGDQVGYDIAAAPFQSIRGSVLGLLTADGSETGPLRADLAPAAAGRATLTATPVDATGASIATTDEPLELESADDGTFSLTGAPGYYRISVSHPEFDALTAANTPADPNVPALPVGVFRLGDDVDTVLADAFALQIRQGRLSLDAVTQLVGGSPVVGAEYDLDRGASSCVGDDATGTLIPTIDTNPDPFIIDLVSRAEVDLDPGQYCLAINKFGAGGSQDAFPAILLVTIPRTSGPAPVPVVVVAPLPSLFPSLTGTLVGRNTASPAAAVDLIATPAPDVTLEFAAPQIDVDGTGTDNLADNDMTVTATKSGLEWTYTFEKVPYGSNTVTAPAIAGYTLADDSQDLPVPDPFGPTQAPPFVYTQPSIGFNIALGAGKFPSLDPALPDNGVPSNLTLTITGTTTAATATPPTFNATTNTLGFTNVPPDSRGYTLRFDDALHPDAANNPAVRDVDVAIAMSSLGNGTTYTVPAGQIVARRVRLAGTAQLQFGPDADDLIDFDAGSRLTLSNGSNTYIVEPPPTPPTPNPSSPGTSIVGANYAIDVVAGTYTLTASRTGYRTTNTNVTLTALGTIVPGNVKIDKYATATVQATMSGSGVSVPAGITYQLRSGGVPYGPRAGTTNTFDVPAGVYEAIVTLTGYGTHVSTSTTTLGIGDGGTTPVNVPITLPRIAQFTVTGPSSATVTLAGKAESHATSAVFAFSDQNPDTDQRIPSSGALTGTAAAAGYRTTPISMPAAAGYHTATVPMLANVTVTGSINAPEATVADQVIWAEAPGVSPVYGSINASGTYTIAGLTTSSGGAPLAWTVEYDEFGVGTGQMAGTYTVAATAAGTTAPASTAINVTGSTLDVTFNVSPAVLSAGATVTLVNPGNTVPSQTTPVDDPATTEVNEATGTVVFELSEATAASLTGWRVSHPNYRTRSNSAFSVTSRSDVTVPVSLAPAITGTVVTGSPAAGVVGATVRICPSTFNGSTPCSTAQSLAETTTVGASGAFTFTTDLANATNYRVWAISGSDDGMRTLAVTTSEHTWQGQGGNSVITIN